MKVILDIGHGGTKTLADGKKITDFGAVNSATGMNEFTWNKDFVENYIIPELNRNNIENKVVLRRIGTEILVQDLNKAANKEDVILSFHLNSSATASGTETLYWITSNNGKRLATLIQARLVKVLGLPNRGIKLRRKPINKEDELNQRGWTMFRDTKVPFVLLESFFISNNNDLNIGTNRRIELAKAVVEAVKEYIGG